MQKTKISWATDVWNVTIGCNNPECLAHCYARDLHNKRHKAYLAGKKLPKQYAKPFEEIQLLSERLEEPLHKRKPCRVFVGSMGDVFDESVPFDFIDKILGAINSCPQHTFMFLTKQEKRMAEYLCGLRDDVKQAERLSLGSGMARHGIAMMYRKGGYLPNLCLGVSILNQEDADKRIPYLLQTPVAKKFISAEPLLSEIKLPKNIIQANLLIIGAETGKNRRPCNLEWVKSLIEQANNAGVKVHVKKLEIDGRIESEITKFPVWARRRETI